jgi:hypothetical protein
MPRVVHQGRTIYKMQIMKRSLFILLLLIVVGLLGWVIDVAWKKDQARGKAQVLALATTHPAEWQLSPEQWGKRVTALQGIALGDRKADVLAKLGKPEVDQEEYTEALYPARKGSIVVYRFVHYELHFENVKWDKSVDIFFDLDGRVKNIASNIPDIASKS